MAEKTLNSDTNYKEGHPIISTVYLYLVAMIGLITFIFGGVGMINTVLQNYVFQVNEVVAPVNYPGSKTIGRCDDPYKSDGNMIVPTAQEIEICMKDEQDKQERTARNKVGRELSSAIAQILIGLPVWLFHWVIIQKEYRKKEENS